ncbi:MAG: FG-GAP repeat protein [Planctomycetes bacterium]|nr:FG-GAP repeat protein [Planctomycetota bacterium]
MTKLTSEPSEEDGFGWSVGLATPFAIVGAANRSCTSSADTCGAAYIYRLDDDIWELDATIDGESVNGGDGFANSVALDGDTVVVSASGEGDVGEVSMGGFRKPGSHSRIRLQREFLEGRSR